MLIRQISLNRGVTVKAANISNNHEIQNALTQLEIPYPRTAIVLVGGAGGIGFLDKFPGLAIDLEAAMSSLPAGARFVFVMHDVEGYGHEEIAELGGFTVGTSKSQLYRARGLLREMLSR